MKVKHPTRKTEFLGKIAGSLEGSTKAGINSASMSSVVVVSESLLLSVCLKVE